MSDEEEEDILEKPLTEFYDSSFEILSKIVLFKFLSLSLLSSVTTLFSVKEIWKNGKYGKAEFTKVQIKL